MSNDNRVSKGIPTGGEFATHNRTEGDSLSPEVSRVVKDLSTTNSARGAQTPDLTIETPEEIAWRLLGGSDARNGIGYERDHAKMTKAVQAGIQVAWESWGPRDPENSLDYEPEQTLPAFKPEGEPDKYRDLWNENMPRVSACMYFAIPGEQPIHVNDDQARRFLIMLSTESFE